MNLQMAYGIQMVLQINTKWPLAQATLERMGFVLVSAMILCVLGCQQKSQYDKDFETFQAEAGPLCVQLNNAGGSDTERKLNVKQIVDEALRTGLSAQLLTGSLCQGGVRLNPDPSVWRRGSINNPNTIIVILPCVCTYASEGKAGRWAFTIGFDPILLPEREKPEWYEAAVVVSQ
jgi:hypothetical protein